MNTATGHCSTKRRNNTMAQPVSMLALFILFAMACELNAGVLGPVLQCFGESETRMLSFTPTRLSLRGGQTGPVLSETASKNGSLRQVRGENPLSTKNNILSVLKSLLSGNLARQADTAKKLDTAVQGKDSTVTSATEETQAQRQKRVDDGWVEISDTMTSEPVNSEVAKAGATEVETTVEAPQDQTAASPASEQVLPVTEEATTENLPEVEESAQEEYKPEEAVEAERPIVPQAFDSEIDSEMFESAMAEGTEVQDKLSEMKSKVGSLRRTQSELEIKLARYRGEDPATVQQDDVALPENLNMKVMQRLLEDLVSKQEMLSGRVEEIAKGQGEAVC